MYRSGVEVELIGFVLPVLVHESPEARNARRVDNDVDVDLSHLGNDVIYCIFFGQICGPAKGVDAVVADEFIDKRLQNLLPAGNEDDIMT